MKSNASLTPARAVAYGHAVITLPVVLIIGLATIMAFFVVRPPSPDDHKTLIQMLLYFAQIDIGVVVGGAVGWLWWSLSVPRWREWAKRRGADKEQTQRLAQRTLLVWPQGSLFEKTEFPTRNRA
jgi:hypothetical protein